MRKDIYQLTYRSEESHWWYVGRRRIILSWLAGSLPRMGGNPAKSLRLLDYGCGTGMNLVHLATIGEAFGVDAAPDAIAFCRQRGIGNVVHAPSPDDLTAASVFGGEFDVVTMFDVLEHIPDEVAALRRIRRLLKPGGLLVLTVPALGWLWSGEDVVSEHLRRYTRSSLSRVLHTAGYDTLRMSYFNSLLFPLQAAVVLWNRAFSPQSMSESMVKQVPRPVNSALTAIVSLESMLLPKLRFPIGASLICSVRAGQTGAPQGTT
jgi:2-polyprenyl-3-methyl-5-hydroxy-6-metoxy-1,4-benzoquinol methylase